MDGGSSLCFPTRCCVSRRRHQLRFSMHLCDLPATSCHLGLVFQWVVAAAATGGGGGGSGGCDVGY